MSPSTSVCGVGAFSWQIMVVRGATQLRYFNSYKSAVDVIVADEAHRIRETSNNRFTPEVKLSRAPQMSSIRPVYFSSSPPRARFFSRHGFRSWLSRKTRIVSRPTRGTSLRFTTSSVRRRTVQRERPSGGGPHATATERCRCCAARPLSPAVAARTRPALCRLGNSVGWSATSSSGSTLRSSLPAGWLPFGQLPHGQSAQHRPHGL
jgi:hypothetical protein